MISFFKKPKAREATIKIKISIYVEKDRDSFVVYCPGLRGLISDGSTEEEALKNFADASNAYIASILKHGEPLPVCTAISGKDIPGYPAIRKDVEIPLDIILNESKDSCSRSA